MTGPRIYIRSVATHLPDPVPVTAAVADGRYPADELAETELTGIRVATDLAAPEMAVLATRSAIERTPASPTEVSALAYAHLYHQGQDFWSPAAYVTQRVLHGSCPFFTVREASNGGMLALDLMASRLAGRAEPSSAYVVTADRYTEPGFDRWRTDVGQIYSDGATSIEVSTRPGFVELLSIVTVADSSLEGLTRDHGCFSDAALQHDTPIDLRRLKRDFLDRAGSSTVFDALTTGTRTVARKALAVAQVSIDEIAFVVLPNVGRETLEWEFLEPLGIPIDRTLWEWGRGVGHLGAGDQFAGLEHLILEKLVRPGDLVLLLNAGLGFTWTAAVAMFHSVPDWN
ncbi:ketoacyl-ACP synthase III family protein [Nocardia sp. CDC159]|uniref:Ketoacyl-ACP synthase III family protein n=1 Tax=Nocardia pulmonis TaxID=2951408 RepID=A0A9X2E9L5_9NOCA|nr:MULTISPECIES: ketoacyl-ACP synthase III family protein [Nocardia]MCM6776657.1 ketoacyl-ACP synthase III family protein [Nocardia pulmonis]MCM6789194.1 ketoacyl-ACP synthase III family protein [Nocardia sp. CDC159]